MKRFKKLFGLVLLLLWVTSCGKAPDAVLEIKGERNIKETSISLPAENIEKEEAKPQMTLDEIINPLTGYGVKKEQKPFMAIIENSKAARPQKGISMADVVFEIPAERPITRYLAIFYGQYPDVLGPIRSTRDYIQDIALSFDLPYAHCGGSYDALQKIKKGKYKSLNEMANGRYYFRDAKRKSPHNLYAKSSDILKLIGDKKYEPTVSNWLQFETPELQSHLAHPEVLSFSVKPSVYVSYKHVYEPEHHHYIRYQDGKIEQDAFNQKPISFVNIGLIEAKIKNTLDSEKHISVQLVGQGPFVLYREGQKIEGIWLREKPEARFMFQDLDGKTISFSKGNTLFYVVEHKTEYLEE